MAVVKLVYQAKALRCAEADCHSAKIEAGLGWQM
jgi:hypothetical protein